MKFLANIYIHVIFTYGSYDVEMLYDSMVYNRNKTAN